jgi:hypothetical protein
MIKNKLMHILVGAFTIVFISGALTKPESIKKQSKHISFAANLTTIDDTTIQIEAPILPTNFDYVYKRFKIFNPNIDTSTVITFNNVCTEFKLDSNKDNLKLCIGQILQESGAKQYYGKGHKKEGKLVIGGGGAIGMTQIMPNTAYGNLKLYMSAKDVDVFYRLGATSFEFIKKDTTKAALVGMSGNWLKDETNNLIMWGFILNKKAKENNGLTKGLVSYNAGIGGLIDYVNSGGSINSHHYIRSIRSRLAIAESKL